MDLPFMVRHFDEKAAELVGFSSVVPLGRQSVPVGMMAAISFTCVVMLIFEQ
jgi:hypothetical protein